MSSVIFFLVFVGINEAVPLCFWYKFYESLCIISEAAPSVGRSDGANVTVLLFFTFSFSKEAVLQRLYRCMYLAWRLVIEEDCTYQGPSQNDASSV